MRFYALLSTAGDSQVAELPDCPGCVAVAGPSEDIGRNASAVLRVWLESLLLNGGLPPLPSPRPTARSGMRIKAIEVPALLALRIQTRHFRHVNGKTIAELAEILGVPESQVQKLEHPAGEPSPRTLQRATEVLGLRAKGRSGDFKRGPQQAELFPSMRSGTLIRMTEISAYDVGTDDPDVDIDLSLTLGAGLLDQIQDAAAAAGLTLSEWLVRAGREKLWRDAPDAPVEGDPRQRKFSFAA